MLEKHILAPGIILYKGNKEKAEEIFNKLNNEFVNRWNNSQVVDTGSYENKLDNARQCQDFGLYPEIMESDDELGKEMYLKTDQWIDPYIQDFISFYKIEKVVGGPYVYIKYGKTDKFDSHVDDGKKYPRTISVSAYINNDYDGGDLEFNHFGIKHKPEVGDIIVFSSSFPYMHKVNPVINGIRYAIVNWYRYHTYPSQME
jgi:hypothetical protein